MTADAIAKTNASESATKAKQVYEDNNREKRNAQRKEYARRSRSSTEAV